MSSLNLKVRVKNGELCPDEALQLLTNKAVEDNINEDEATAQARVDQACKSRTARWLCSPNADKRYRQGRKARQAS